MSAASSQEDFPPVKFIPGRDRGINQACAASGQLGRIPFGLRQRTKSWPASLATRNARSPPVAKSYFQSVVIEFIVPVKASQEIINDEVSHFAA